MESTARAGEDGRPNPLDELGLDALRRRTSAKWRAYPPDVLPLWVAEMDVATPPGVRAAIERAVSDGDLGYPDGDRYAEAMAAFAERRWGWTGLSVGRTSPVADVMTGIAQALLLVTRPGDPVIVTTPVYAPFFAVVRAVGRELYEVPLGPDGRLDLPALSDAFAVLRTRRGAGGAAMLLANPHNPTGAVHTDDELSELAAAARAYDVRVLSDEIHAPLVLPGAHVTPYLSVPGAADGFAVLSASKAWNLAAVKAALLVAGEEAADDLARLPPEVRFGASHLGTIAHVAALESDQDWLDRLLGGLDRNRRLFGSLLAEQLPAIRWTPPEGTYLGWLDCSGLDLPEPYAADPAAFFLERARVALSPGHTFGTGGAGCARINLACSEQTLTAAVDAMATAMASIG